MRGERAPQRRRGRRARAHRRLQAAARRDARRQAHARARPVVDRADRRRARRPARGRLRHAVDRARHALHAGGAARARRARARPRHAPARRRLPAHQRRRRAGRAAAGDHDRRGRRRRLLRRDEGGPDARARRSSCSAAGSRSALPYLRKQSMQLASKMRYIAAQFEALLTDELWRRAAGHANAMAARLAAAVEGIDGVRITQAVQANVVFAVLPPGVAERLQAGVGLLHLGRAHRRGALDVRARHARGGRRRVRRRGGGRRGMTDIGLDRLDGRGRGGAARRARDRRRARARAAPARLPRAHLGAGRARAPTGSTAAWSRSRRAR